CRQSSTRLHFHYLCFEILSILELHHAIVWFLCVPLLHYKVVLRFVRYGIIEFFVVLSAHSWSVSLFGTVLHQILTGILPGNTFLFFPLLVGGFPTVLHSVMSIDERNLSKLTRLTAAVIIGATGIPSLIVVWLQAIRFRLYYSAVI